MREKNYRDHAETSRGVGFVYYLDCADAFMGV